MKSCELFKIIGENIKNLRKEKGLKGEILAKELGVTKAAISQLENGLVDFKISTLHQIAYALDTNLISLIEGSRSIESEFADYRFKSEQHLKTIEMLVCRIEQLNEQIECMGMKKAG